MKFLLTGYNLMPEIDLRQQELIYSACGPFVKRLERIQKVRETGN